MKRSDIRAGDLLRATVLMALLALPAMALDDLKPRDLTPVTWLKAPTHAPVEIVRDGQPCAVVYVTEGKPGEKLRRLTDELIEVIRLSTGATLERVAQPPAQDRPAIIIGDCEETRAAGIDPAKIPPEGFVVRTATNRMYLVGGAGNPDGSAWAVADFLERFIGVRWYWPADAAGRSIRRTTSLVAPPAHYTDQPVFRRRIDFIETALMPLNTEGHNWGDRMPLPLAPGVMSRDETWWYVPRMEALLRHGESLDFTPGIIQGSEAIAWWLSRWGHERDIQKAGEAARALNQDGSRHELWICFSAPETLDALLARLSRHWDEKAGGGPPHKIMTDTSCTVYFPRTPGLVCHCQQCEKTAARLRNDRTLRAALASDGGDERADAIIEERVHELVFGLFVQRLCEAVKQRWPDKKVVLNAGERKPPEGVTFPDNLRVASVWPDGFVMGHAFHPSVGPAFDNTIRGWGQVLIWASCSSPGDWTYGPVQYPHLVQEFLLRNRRYITGTELTVFSAPILVSQSPTYYVWQRALWNPEIDVEAILDEMCRRLFGKGAKSARELMRLQCDRWEKTPLPRPLQSDNLHRDQLPGCDGIGTLALENRLPADLFAAIWPTNVVAQMKELRAAALTEIDQAGDTDARRALLYWTWTFDAFLEEAATVHRRIPADLVRETRNAPLGSVEGLPETVTLDLGGGTTLKLALIRPGEFLMGSVTNAWGYHPNESPQHRVRITKPFFMGVHEVTRAQYDAVMGTAIAGDGSNRPAASVSWRQATNFCARLSASAGRNVRLPTEAEWEYACRAGSTTVWSFGDLDRIDAMKDHAWFGQDARGGPRDVGGKKPNAWGLYDMHGNVSEWCLDRFGADYYPVSPIDDPTGPDSGMFRVLRSGSADNLGRRNAEFARSARRSWGHPDLNIAQRGMNRAGIGFRVVVQAAGAGK
jgi:formylglycine-generating enzyme required for sulfatase activity